MLVPAGQEHYKIAEILEEFRDSLPQKTHPAAWGHLIALNRLTVLTLLIEILRSGKSVNTRELTLLLQERCDYRPTRTEPAATVRMVLLRLGQLAIQWCDKHQKRFELIITTDAMVTLQYEPGRSYQDALWSIIQEFPRACANFSIVNNGNGSHFDEQKLKRLFQNEWAMDLLPIAGKMAVWTSLYNTAVTIGRQSKAIPEFPKAQTA